ncbi:MAG: hypothetical protein QXF41_01830 [Candidatus Micrarchaeaceae archaeon]
MHKGIIAYIVILVLLIIVALILYLPSQHPKITTTTATTTANKTTTSTTIPIGVTTKTTSVPTTIFSLCTSANETVPIANGDFSTGTYAGWNVTGYGFGTAPLNITYANENGGYYNHTWTGINYTFIATTFHGGLALQPGNITSAPFKVVEPYLNFKIISPQNNLLYIELLQNGKVVFTVHYNTYAAPNNQYPTSEFVNASIPISIFMCQNISIRVVAGVVGTIATHSQYIAVTGFYQSKTPTYTPDIVVNQTITP